MTSAYISEIFPTVQGEGPYTGEKQVFIRIAGCPLRCTYCDTPESLVATGHPQMTAEGAAAAVQQTCQENGIGTVSVTGGEPLAHVNFLKEFLPRLKLAGLRVYLETAGVHPDALQEVLSSVDVVAMDIKLPSATGRSYWDEHRRFLSVGAEKTFVKIVIERKSEEAEIATAIGILREQTRPPVLVLQPVSPDRPDIVPPDPDQLSRIYTQAKAALPEVLVLPQQHKAWGIR